IQQLQVVVNEMYKRFGEQGSASSMAARGSVRAAAVELAGRCGKHCGGFKKGRTLMNRVQGDLRCGYSKMADKIVRCALCFNSIKRRQRTTKTATEEYEDDETEDGPVDYPMDGGDDDDGDSSGDDADDEDEDDEDEDEEEEHLAPTDFAVVVPADEPVSPPEGTEPVIPQPSTDLTIGARIIVRH
ncbi:hypothetical protein Tco_0863610, partial [Tanacetum coccineum]